jgi:hypothetical protein
MQNKSQWKPSAASVTAIAYSKKRSTDENNSFVARRSQTAHAPVAKRSPCEGPDPRNRDCRQLQLRSLGSSVPRLCRARCCSTETGPSDFNTDEEISKHMEYLIVFSVAAMMTMYVWILARYLQHA